MKRLLLVCSILIIIQSLGALGQQYNTVLSCGGVGKTHINSDNFRAVNLKDSLTYYSFSNFNNPNEEATFIVTLTADPLSLVNNKNQDNYTINIQDALIKINLEQERLISELKRIENLYLEQKNVKHEKPIFTIEAKYNKVINGLAIRTNTFVFIELRKLNFVKNIVKDFQLKIDLNDAIHIINADSVWLTYGLEGDSIKIGIIDTGIDYYHPDLGGGFGSEFKVYGGKDFVNDDLDPMDDNGHGTHIAGIISADGAIKGVAPHSNLLAIKAFDDTGWGRWWHILSALDYALDPDDDPLTNDRVDIINMSWGSQENPYDETISNAVENLENTGVIFVASAGNGGPNYRTLNSPAVVPHVIAVGNITKADSINNGSSRGPAISNLSIKPDLVAPGTDIISTNLNGGYVSMSGSSMATPMVSGAAALLLQKHPEWSPELIKSKLKNSAANIGYNQFTQGAGKVDVFKAAKSETVAYPSSINLDVIEGDSNNLCTLNKIINFYNSGNDTVNYSTSYNNPVGDGLNIIINNPDGNVNPNSSIQLNLTFNFDLTLIPSLDLSNPNWLPYTGSIKIYSNIDTSEISVQRIKQVGNYSFHTLAI